MFTPEEKERRMQEMMNDPEWMRVLASCTKGFAGIPAYPNGYEAWINDFTKF